MDKFEHLQLLPTETVIHSNTNYYVEHNGDNVDLYLTNLNIICTTGKPGKPKYKIYKYPINDIKIVNGNLQIRLDDNFNEHTMKIFLSKGVACFGFQNIKDAKVLLSNIKQIVTGDVYSINIEEKEKAPQGLLNRAVFGVASGAASVIKSGVNGIKKGFGIKSKNKKNDEIDLYVGNIGNSNMSSNKYQEELNAKRLKEEREYKLQMARIKSESQNVQPIVYQSQQTQSEYKYCIYCGAKINANASFCSECGSKLK